MQLAIFSGSLDSQDFADLNSRAMAMNHRIARGFIVILRSEWLPELACEQVITNRKRIGTGEITTYEAVSELATKNLKSLQASAKFWLPFQVRFEL
jgi:hypothetical protein